MKSRMLLALVVGGLLLGNTGPLWSGGEKEQPDFKKLMELYGTPGPEHKNLEPMHGKWDAVAKMYMPGQKEPMVSKGKAEMTWSLGKRYLKQHYTGDMMGEEFKGVGNTAYDRFKKKYIFTWMDNMATGIMYAEGDYDAKAKTFTFLFTTDDPFLGKGVKARDVIKILSDDEHVFDMYRTVGKGEEFKLMQITYKRQAKKVEKE